MQPNVILVLTDDQGYGDLSGEGNPVIRTPNLDAFRGESVRLTNFHVGPTCAPTRAGLLTGLYSGSVGVWHTIGGRSIVREKARMLPQVLQEAGYRTGLFGKWHLGDTWPYRPQDRGFETVVTHGGGGVGQQPDHWGNDYFDDTYEVNGVPRRFEGYCTDVWFEQALAFIEDHRHRPFFCYIAPNAPHDPYNVPHPYFETYQGEIEDDVARFYGMITNIDENFARLRQRLVEWGLDRNTILIFMTDNGSSCSLTDNNTGFPRAGFNAGLRGGKGSPYDGGHRVPVYLRWPQGQILGGKDVSRITANVDLMPTLLALCGVEVSAETPCHGNSLVPLLTDPQCEWPERVMVTESQRVLAPIKWRKSCVMTDRWRLIEGTELYDALRDRGQRHDLSDRYRGVVEELRQEYETWWDLVYRDADDPIPFPLGAPDGPRELRLNCMDWRYPEAQDDVPWHQGQVRAGVPMVGYWEIDVKRAGRYRFELRRWPRESGWALGAGIEGTDIPWNQEETDPRFHSWYQGGEAIPIVNAEIRAGEQRRSAPVDPTAPAAILDMDLTPGATTLAATFSGTGAQEIGAYYVYVQFMQTGTEP